MKSKMIGRIATFLRSHFRKLERLARPSASHRRDMANWALWGGEREYDILHALVDPSKGALDVGANVGVYTSRLSELVPFVWAIEPNPELCARIRKARYPNVKVVEAAVSNRAGFANLHFPMRDDGSRSTTCATLEAVDDGETIQVRVMPLDDFQDQPIGFVKIDIEGHEPKALKGARQFFEKQRPSVVIEVEGGNDFKNVAAVSRIFEDMNYRGFFVRRRSLEEIENFQSRMQDRSLLRKSLPRRESDFVNNFIFLPYEAEEVMRKRIMGVLE